MRWTHHWSHLTEAMEHSFVRWNLRGFQANFEELALLLRQYRPALFGLQETFLTNFKLSSFSGGVALLINKSCLVMFIWTPLCRQWLQGWRWTRLSRTFCSIYLPPSDQVAKTDLINLIKQLPSPFVLLGNFNGHSPIWGNESYNSRGQMLEDLFSEMDLFILNDGSLTYIHPATGSTSALDLSICGPSLVLD